MSLPNLPGNLQYPTLYSLLTLVISHSVSSLSRSVRSTRPLSTEQFHTKMEIKHFAEGSTEPVTDPGKIYLYSMRFCPYAHRAHLILNAKQINYEPIYINLAKKPKWYLNKFPAGKVPALLYKGEFLYESLLLVDFLNEEFPENPLYPTNPTDKLKDKILIENFGKITVAFYRLAMVEFKNEDYQILLSGLQEYEDALNKRETKFFGGEKKPLMIDYMIWPWFERLEILLILNGPKAKIPFEKYPTLDKWISHMKEDEAVKKHYLKPEQYGKHFVLRKKNDDGAFDIV